MCSFEAEMLRVGTGWVLGEQEAVIGRKTPERSQEHQQPERLGRGNSGTAAEEAEPEEHQTEKYNQLKKNKKKRLKIMF